MGNILMNPKCPFLIVNKFCTHKDNPPNSHRVVCGYKDYLTCELFLNWSEQLHSDIKSSPERLKIDLNHTLQPTRPKRCKVCKKMLYPQNKSGYCSSHYKRIKNKKND